jgi:hypothetical protein
MRLNYCGSFHRILAIGLMAGGFSFAAIVPTFEGPGVQTPDITDICNVNSPCVIGTENFGTLPLGLLSGTFPTNFGFGIGGAISGTYSGSIVGLAADQYGGAGGTAPYPEVYAGNSYTLTLNNTSAVPGVNYFGLWISALDSGNLLTFYEKGAPIYSFTLADFLALIGSCPNAFCGNPTPAFLGADSGQQYAFLNFFDTSGYFDQVVVSEDPGFSGNGFETANQTVAYLDPGNPHGDPIYGTPEPGSLGLFVAGGILIALGVRRRAGAAARIG